MIKYLYCGIVGPRQQGLGGRHRLAGHDEQGFGERMERSAARIVPGWVMSSTVSGSASSLTGNVRAHGYGVEGDGGAGTCPG